MSDDPLLSLGQRDRLLAWLDREALAAQANVTQLDLFNGPLASEMAERERAYAAALTLVVERLRESTRILRR